MFLPVISQAPRKSSRIPSFPSGIKDGDDNEDDNDHDCNNIYYDDIDDSNGDDDYDSDCDDSNGDDDYDSDCDDNGDGDDDDDNNGHNGEDDIRPVSLLYRKWAISAQFWPYQYLPELGLVPIRIGTQQCPEEGKPAKPVTTKNFLTTSSAT